MRGKDRLLEFLNHFQTVKLRSSYNKSQLEVLHLDDGILHSAEDRVVKLFINAADVKTRDSKISGSYCLSLFYKECLQLLVCIQLVPDLKREKFMLCFTLWKQGYQDPN